MGQTRSPTLKRVIDVVGGCIGFVVFLVPMAVVALAVRIKLGRPVLFVQTRPGLHGQPFRLYKFRTLLDLFDAEGRLLPDADRLTPFGRFLRSTSLDELPELYNVVRGDMSLVGPRPLLMEYLDRYTPEQARRHNVRPGLTGLSQVQGRNAQTWERKLELDTWYAEHWTLWLDCKILLRTVVKVLRREGITQPGSATAEEFLGDRQPPAQPDSL